MFDGSDKEFRKLLTKKYNDQKMKVKKNLQEARDNCKKFHFDEQVDILRILSEIILKKDEYNEVAQNLLKSSHHHERNIDRLSHVGYHIFGGYTKNSIKNACDQVLGSLEYHYFRKAVNSLSNTDNDTPPTLWMIYPMVLFDGPIFSVTSTTDDITLNPIPWITYIHRYRGRNHLVDIVSWKSFSDYISIIESEIRKFKRKSKKIEYDASQIKIKDINLFKALSEFKGSMT